MLLQFIVRHISVCYDDIPILLNQTCLCNTLNFFYFNQKYIYSFSNSNHCTNNCFNISKMLYCNKIN